MHKKTLLDKIWESHTVTHLEDGFTLLYIDRHLIHEVTSPQAFEGLRLNKRTVRKPELTFATMDHIIPTIRQLNGEDEIASTQIKTLEANCKEFGITLFDPLSKKQGIVHVMGPELGLTLPGSTIVCGDSHTATHGAFGALAFGIGTSQVEHVFATQCLISKKPKSYLVKFTGKLPQGVTAKDMILYFIGQIGTAGGTEHVFEFCGNTLSEMSMESRMTVCNMSIEAGARAGMMSPDKTVFDYLSSSDREFAPQGSALQKQIDKWKLLTPDSNAEYDQRTEIDVTSIAPQVTWGTNPQMVCGVDERIPSEESSKRLNTQDIRNALEYMGLKPGKKITDIEVDVVFIGSCTNGRIEDLEAAAKILKGKKIHKDVTALIVPGSQKVKAKAESLGLDKIFKDAGAEWREPGCSMCLAMNADKVPPGKRCASTSNRNFEGRQGKGSRTHLVSPIMAAAAAIHGKFVDVREFASRV